jgi:hypothetical protein
LATKKKFRVVDQQIADALGVALPDGRRIEACAQCRYRIAEWSGLCATCLAREAAISALAERRVVESAFV